MYVNSPAKPADESGGPQGPATSSHVSLTPKSFAAPPPPPWLKWLRRPPTPCCSPSPPWRSSKASMMRSMASPSASEKEGTYPSRTSSPSALDSTLAEAGGAEDCHEASTRYASTSFPSALLFFFLNYLRWTNSARNGWHVLSPAQMNN